MISLITITRDNLIGLQKTHASIAAQTYEHIEWIVIDGASADTTQAWLSNLNESTLSTSISEPDNGIFDAMNKGIEHARGDYILFLNAGDTLADQDTLERIDSTIKMTGAPDFIYGDAHEEMPKGKLFYKHAHHHSKIAHGMITHHQSMLYKRETLGDMRYDLSYKLASDYDFTSRFLKRAKRAHHCDFSFCVFEAGGVSQRHAKKGRKEEYKIRRALNLCSTYRARLIYLRQALALAIRKNTPWLYRLLKSL